MPARSRLPRGMKKSRPTRMTKVPSVEDAMRDWAKLTNEEKEEIFNDWEMSAGERWEEEFSQLKVDELFDSLGGTELPRMILSRRRHASKK